MGFSHIAQIMNELKKQLGMDADFFTIAKVWNHEVNIASTQICGYKNGTIIAQTQSSTALAEINLRKKEIIKKMNQYLGETKIKNIKITIKEE
jgi:hypothetical protein